MNTTQSLDLKLESASFYWKLHRSFNIAEQAMFQEATQAISQDSGEVDALLAEAYKRIDRIIPSHLTSGSVREPIATVEEVGVMDILSTVLPEQSENPIHRTMLRHHIEKDIDCHYQFLSSGKSGPRSGFQAWVTSVNLEAAAQNVLPANLIDTQETRDNVLGRFMAAEDYVAYYDWVFANDVNPLEVMFEGRGLSTDIRSRLQAAITKRYGQPLPRFTATLETYASFANARIQRVWPNSRLRVVAPN